MTIKEQIEVEKILKQIESTFEGCNLQIQGSAIWVRRGRVLLHILDYNTLEYFEKTNQLKEYLKRL